MAHAGAAAARTLLGGPHLGINDLIATEVEVEVEVVEGRCTARTFGTLNMREGKVQRLLEWLSAQQLDAQLLREATFFSDSINDLPLLQAVGTPVVADPDAHLRAESLARCWPALELPRSSGEMQPSPIS